MPKGKADVIAEFTNRTAREIGLNGEENVWSKKDVTRLDEVPTMIWGYMEANGFTHPADDRTRPAKLSNPAIVGLEEKFTFEFAGLKFQGMIDQIRQDQKTGEFILVDIKTGENAPSQIMLDLGYQFSVYAYAMEHGVFESGTAFGLPAEIWQCQVRDYVPLKRGPKKGELRGPVIYKTYRTPIQLEEVMGNIAKICAQIISQIFPRHPSWACVMCRYQEMCTQFIGEETNIDLLGDLSSDGNIW